MKGSGERNVLKLPTEKLRRAVVRSAIAMVLFFIPILQIYSAVVAIPLFVPCLSGSLPITCSSENRRPRSGEKSAPSVVAQGSRWACQNLRKHISAAMSHPVPNSSTFGNEPDRHGLYIQPLTRRALIWDTPLHTSSRKVRLR